MEAKFGDEKLNEPLQLLEKNESVKPRSIDDNFMISKRLLTSSLRVTNLFCEQILSSSDFYLFIFFPAPWQHRVNIGMDGPSGAPDGMCAFGLGLSISFACWYTECSPLVDLLERHWARPIKSLKTASPVSGTRDAGTFHL